MEFKFTIGKPNISNVDRKQPKRVDIEKKIFKLPLLQVRQDIQKWNRAVDRARSYTNPDRTDLMDTYRDVSVDGHLTGIVTDIKNTIKSKEFQLVDKEGNVNDEATLNFKKKWFYDYLEYAVDSIFYGYSLIQLGDIRNDYFDYVELIPREYVVPDLGLVKRQLRGIATHDNSIDYTKPPYNAWTILLGSSGKDLGLYHNIVPHAIGKKNLLIGMWDNAELFGTPIRLIKTDTSDEDRRRYAEQALEAMGSNASGVIDTDDDLTLLDRKTGNVMATFLEPYRMSNLEMSKAIAGQTMMFDDGSSKSQAEVHERIFNQICSSYSINIGFDINRDLLPRMVRLIGSLYEGLEYEWVTKEQLTLTEKVDNVSKLAREGFLFEDGFVEDYTGLKVEQSHNLGIEEGKSVEKVIKDIQNMYYGKNDLTDI